MFSIRPFCGQAALTATSVSDARRKKGAWKSSRCTPATCRWPMMSIWKGLPRARSLGSTQTLPSEDRMSISEPELRDHLAVLLAGRAAERLVYDESTVGAENDLERATQMARRMVMNWGMSDRLGPVSYKLSDEDPFLGREIHQQRQFSEHTMELIDEEVARILREQSDRASDLLTSQRHKLNELANRLLEKEELDEREIETVLGRSVHAKHNGQPAVEISP